MLVAFSLLVAVSTVAQQMPCDPNAKRKPELIELQTLDSSIKLDVRYATTNNFTGRAVYSQPKVFLQRPAAEALVRVHRRLKQKGYGLVVFDGYRPWSVTKLFWEVTPPHLRQFVADPAKGSRHNRGCAVDVSLYELASGLIVTMPSEYDEMSERAHINYSGGSKQARELRDLLRSEMEAEGFKVLDVEWWHYDYELWQEYPILNLDFSEIR
ncbi:MAG: M15 family metallopeptidase [Acidobacteriota bacterium]|nr:M15 family metallopeptidase [Blastocatellia bacterium]MDW8412170.1 M15 family metallopeptidase [Acidobacteriota bacterium]